MQTYTLWVYSAHGALRLDEVPSGQIVYDIKEAIVAKKPASFPSDVLWQMYLVDTHKTKTGAPLDDESTIPSPSAVVRVWVEPIEFHAVATSSAVPGTSRQMHMKCRGVVGTWVMVMGVDLWE